MVDAGKDIVVPIDLATNTVGPSIALDGTPSAIVVTPDGKTAYVTGQNSYLSADPSGGYLMPINLAIGVAGPKITIAGLPAAMAITPNRETVYVGFPNGGNVTIIGTSTNSVIKTITLGAGVEPDAIAFSS